MKNDEIRRTLRFLQWTALTFVLTLGLRHFAAVFFLVLQGNASVINRCRTTTTILCQRHALTRPLLLGVFPFDAVHLIHSDTLAEQLRSNILIGCALLTGFSDELHNLFVGHFLLRAHVRSAREHTKHKNNVSSHETKTFFL